MHPNTARVRTRVRETLGEAVEIRVLPAGTHTATEAAEAIGCPLGAIVKTVVFLAGSDPVIAFTAGDHEVNADGLATHLSVEAVSLATPEAVKSITGWSIGGVPPIGHGVERTVLDPQLLEYEEIWGGAGTPEAVVAVDPQALRDETGATVLDVFE
jgi:prolyl-tRNA editing enzyme YbaK/EbsC (Cys-tRNA(Pro) deacylase)